jgi:hypothetical protein
MINNVRRFAYRTVSTCYGIYIPVTGDVFAPQILKLTQLLKGSHSHVLGNNMAISGQLQTHSLWYLCTFRLKFEQNFELQICER